VNLDQDDRLKADVYFDLNTLAAGARLPFDDDSVDLVVANHIVEHLDIPAFIPFMNECRRVLKPGCQMHIETPSPLCEWFHQDPTHRRGYTCNTFTIYFVQGIFATYGIQVWASGEARQTERIENGVQALVVNAIMTK